MDRCPTCRAIYRESNICYRCQTDLRQVLAVERASARYRQQALTELQSRRVYSAYDYARRPCELHRSPNSIKALALVSLTLRRFNDALSLWHEYREASLSDG